MKVLLRQWIADWTMDLAGVPAHIASSVCPPHPKHMWKVIEAPGCLSNQGTPENGMLKLQRTLHNLQVMICFKLLWKAQVNASCIGLIEEEWRNLEMQFFCDNHTRWPWRCQSLLMSERMPLYSQFMNQGHPANTQSYNKVNVRPSKISIQCGASSSRTLWSPLPGGPVVWEVVHLINFLGLFLLLGP